jgi:hypothetical protein
MAASKTKVLMIGCSTTMCVLLLAFASLLAGRKLTAQQSAAASHPRHGGFTQPEPIDFNDHTGWTQIFDGKSLKDWDGSPDVWHVEDGAIVAESSPDHPSGTTNIIWKGGEPANFELKVEMKLEGAGANGGIQYRSDLAPGTPSDKQKYAKWGLRGYQADFDFANRYTGQLYEQGTSRGIVAWRGQMVETDPDQKPRLLAMVGSSDELKSYIKQGDWNQYEIIAEGNTLIHIINGHVMAILVDNDPAFSRKRGRIGFEIEGGGVVKISQRNIWLKSLP